MLMECFLEPTYEWEIFNPAVHSDRDCFEVQFLKSNYYLASLYHLHETDLSYSLVGNTLMDQINEGDDARLELIARFESEILTPTFGLSYADVIADGVPAYTAEPDWGMVDYAGVYQIIFESMVTGVFPVAPQVVDELSAYISEQIADWENAELIRQDVKAILVDIITTAQAEAAAS